MFPNVGSDGAQSTRVGSPSSSDKEKAGMVPPAPTPQNNFTPAPQAGGKSVLTQARMVRKGGGLE